MRNKLAILLFIALAISCVVCGFIENNNSTPTTSVMSVTTSVAEHDIDSLMNYSNLIISGRVKQQSDFILSADSTYRSSQVEIEVIETYKGSTLPGEKIVVELNTYRGVQGVNAEDEPMLPEFSVNDEVCLFLIENDHNSYYIVGINQGAYYKSTERSSHKLFVRKNIIGYGPESINIDQLVEMLNNLEG